MATEPADQSALYENYRSIRHFGSLDGIRALSILAVVWHHAENTLCIIPAARLGFLGVDMFFVLSGFLIVTLLLRERDRTGGISLKGFYLRRSLRIVPVYYGLLLILSVASVIRPQSHLGQTYPHDLPYLLTYTANWVPMISMMGIAWSLACEEQFYLLWPPIEKRFPTRALIVLFIILAVSQSANFLHAILKFPDRFENAIMAVSHFTPISLGVLLSHVLHSRRGFGKLAPLLAPPWVPLFLLVALVLLCNVVPADISGWPRLSIHILMALLLASCVIRKEHWLTPILDRNPLRRIGVVSYGIYLYHLFGQHLGNALLSRMGVSFTGALFITSLLITWAGAELSFRLYESPFLRLKDRLSRSRAVPVEETSILADGQGEDEGAAKPVAVV